MQTQCNILIRTQISHISHQGAVQEEKTRSLMTFTEAEHKKREGGKKEKQNNLKIDLMYS